jgi:integrase
MDKGWNFIVDADSDAIAPSQPPTSPSPTVTPAFTYKRQRLIPGLVLQIQPNSRFIQARAFVNGKGAVASMRTEDWREAAQRAVVWFVGIKSRADRGQDLRAVSWAELVEDYKEQLEKGSRRTYHVDTIARHLDPFFSSFRDVSRITSAVVLDYFAQRRSKSSREPLPQTINRENAVLRQLIDHARAKRWIVEVPEVPFFSEAMTRRRREHFTVEELRRLRVTAIQRIRSAKYGGDNRERINVLPYRQLLYDVIMIMANSGLRVDELHTVRWRDIIWERGDIQLAHAGKTRSSRRLILRLAAIRALRRLALRRFRWQRENAEVERLPPNERVIALPCGTHVKQMKSSWEGLLADAGFTYAEGQHPHVLTSLRHTYATTSLTRTDGPRPNLHVLALQMGTSIRMITRHYAHDTVDEHRDELGAG